MTRLRGRDEPLAVKPDCARNPERNDTQSVRAVGHVLGQAQELQRAQRDGRAITSQGADESADEASYGGEQCL